MPNIGKVLFVDDKYDTISDGINSFLEKGLHVQYWNGSGELPSGAYNVRIVILDLDLADLGMKTPGDEFYVPAVEALNKIPGPFIVIILAREFEDDDPVKLEKVYANRYGSLRGFIAKKGLKKEDLEDPENLEKLVLSLLEENKILSLILSWELVFDKSKDTALSEIIIEDVGSSIVALVNIVCENFGVTKDAAYEIIAVIMQIVSRKTMEIEETTTIVELLKEINETKLNKNSKEYFSVYNRLKFRSPSNEEIIITGDIFQTDDKFKYGIVLTPKCDLIQEKTKKVLLCYGFPLNEKFLDDMKYPPYKIHEAAIAKIRENGGDQKALRDYLKARYIRSTNKLPDNLFKLLYFRSDDGTFGFCFNFNNIQSINIDELKKWKRRCRLNSPYIDEIVQKYVGIVQRIGKL
jgi:hypothetical protein